MDREELQKIWDQLGLQGDFEAFVTKAQSNPEGFSNFLSRKNYNPDKPAPTTQEIEEGHGEMPKGILEEEFTSIKHSLGEVKNSIEIENIESAIIGIVLVILVLFSPRLRSNNLSLLIASLVVGVLFGICFAMNNHYLEDQVYKKDKWVTIHEDDYYRYSKNKPVRTISIYDYEKTTAFTVISATIAFILMKLLSNILGKKKAELKTKITHASVKDSQSEIKTISDSNKAYLTKFFDLNSKKGISVVRMYDLGRTKFQSKEPPISFDEFSQFAKEYHKRYL